MPRQPKLGRTRNPRRALLRGLATALIDQQRITTTRPKAKALVPYVERLITKAKRGDLANRRRIMTKVATRASAHRLVDHLAGQLGGRSSGHLRLRSAGWRQGDHSPLATVSFVDLEPVAAAKKEGRSTAKTKAVASDQPTGQVRADHQPATGTKPRGPGRKASTRNRANQKRI